MLVWLEIGFNLLFCTYFCFPFTYLRKNYLSEVKLIQEISVIDPLWIRINILVWNTPRVFSYYNFYNCKSANSLKPNLRMLPRSVQYLGFIISILSGHYIVQIVKNAENRSAVLDSNISMLLFVVTRIFIVHLLVSGLSSDKFKRF